METDAPCFKFTPINGANITNILLYIVFLIALFPKCLEGIDNNSINNIDHNKDDSEVEDPFKNKFRKVLIFLLNGLQWEAEAGSGSDSIGNQGQKAV